MREAKPIQVEHKGIKVTYIEGDNTWEFTLRGRTRRGASLSDAKKAIEVVPKEKRSFKSFSAYHTSRWEDEQFGTVEVTSLAEKDRWSGNYNWWIKNTKNKHEKVDGDKLYVMNAANAERIRRCIEIDVEVATLNEERARLVKSLLRIKPTTEMLEGGEEE